MRIWAHRGCSQMYPENTLTAFRKAMNIPHIAGIELDIQLTKDGELVVIHDEKVDRTTDGYGYVRDYTLAELRNLHIYTGTEKVEHIPTMREVLELLGPKLRDYKRGEDPSASRGIRLNIELKNSVFPYPGVEEKIVDMVHEFGVQDAIVYSTFYADSLIRVHELDPEAELGVLDDKVSDCLYKAMGLERLFVEKAKGYWPDLCKYAGKRAKSGADESTTGEGLEGADGQASGADSAESAEDAVKAGAQTVCQSTSESTNPIAGAFKFALHPYGKMMDVDEYMYSDRTIRAWYTGHLYPEKPTGGKLDIFKYEAMGITDIFLNEPEKYL